MRLGRFCFSALIGAAILLAPVRAGAASYFPLAYWLDGADHPAPGESTVRQYAAQDVRTNDLRAEYFGWKGVKGSIYWAKNAYLPKGTQFALACLSVKTATTDWLQPGIIQFEGGRPHFYIEYVVHGKRLALKWSEAPVDSAASASVNHLTFIDSYGVWESRINGLYLKKPLDAHSSGKPTSPVEVSALPGFYGYVSPTAYFGTNRSSYNGSALALHLMNGASEWELWDETLTGGRTVAHDTDSTAHMHYSTGLKCYYWLGRND